MAEIIQEYFDMKKTILGFKIYYIVEALQDKIDFPTEENKIAELFIELDDEYANKPMIWLRMGEKDIVFPFLNSIGNLIYAAKNPAENNDFKRSS
jgi:hypothetical protein